MNTRKKDDYMYEPLSSDDKSINDDAYFQLLKQLKPYETVSPIYDFPYYYITSHGRVFSTLFNKLRRLSTSLVGHGYEYLNILLFGVRQGYYVHRLVAEHFIDNPDGKPHINHKNGDKTCNHIQNLEWVTRSENIQHAIHILGKHVGRPKKNNN